MRIRKFRARLSTFSGVISTAAMLMSAPAGAATFESRTVKQCADASASYEGRTTSILKCAEAYFLLDIDSSNNMKITGYKIRYYQYVNGNRAKDAGSTKNNDVSNITKGYLSGAHSWKSADNGVADGQWKTRPYPETYCKLDACKVEMKVSYDRANTTDPTIFLIFNF